VYDGTITPVNSPAPRVVAQFEHRKICQAEEMTMATTTVPKPDHVWLKWEDKLDLLGSQHPIVFSPVMHKEEARGDEKERVEALLQQYRSNLERSEPGYTWRIEPHEARPILKYVIRGDRTAIGPI
jgi:hypothetical protein